LIVGLVTNAIRAVVVRGALPPERYRGPAIGVLLLLAVIVAAVVSLGAGTTAVALLDGGELSVGGTLLLLTSTQFSLLAIVGLLVVAPRALVGVRLLPESGLVRSLGIGLLAAVPAWIGATLLAYLWTALLEGIGLVQGVAIAEAVVERGDPTVVLVAFVAVAPIAEELFFRGVAYNAWIRERGPRFALYGSAALFALIHGSVFALAPISALGIALALVYRRTGSLPAAMAMHAGFNAISVVLTLLVRQGILNLPT
jgi:membrane protease YdiL (CAAX protease family)